VVTINTILCDDVRLGNIYKEIRKGTEERGTKDTHI
jgi:hypothetical protein